MATPAAAERPTKRHTPIASATHTLLSLVLILLLTLVGARISRGLRSSPANYRLALYAWTIITHWCVLAFILWTVRRHGTSVMEVLGRSWRSSADLFRDIALGAAFWVVTVLALSMLRPILNSFAAAPSVLFLLPQTAREKLVWILVSITAGICEEAVYRGYFQKQFISASRSILLGIFLSGVLFGLVHLYQGVQGAVLNAFNGILLGFLAAWRRSLRPGMIAHGWNDVFAGVVAGMLKIRVG